MANLLNLGDIQFPILYQNIKIQAFTYHIFVYTRNKFGIYTVCYLIKWDQLICRASRRWTVFEPNLVVLHINYMHL